MQVFLMDVQVYPILFWQKSILKFLQCLKNGAVTYIATSSANNFGGV